ncbi:hypothetical protein X821_gp101 [Mycobacterium phage Zaka]|uniref:Uncharacterized protein n=6 Tax=Gladiatorvirus TaxID=2948726 RepID=A0A1C9LYP7_9CAUD|nr:hypothetical protein X820_gp103 [Mycobacterium phage CloudWang3]YP_008859119.1 hypothetical protein X821_gp101 [Mycobacterium phage Zaka]YP_009014500.1 hypothetical protein CL99_gp103 [Mycobacterium phage Blue7]YP_009635506.1 hypothetical protein FGG54_gp96 [Mycobacterium phage Gladiator]YP_009636527.1 hypothetical protein FGG22_gp104 [Mycobacterium phage Hammer]AOQ28026.1 hypothetical protein SEA_GRUUNAGA_12 [Mycobacterium phage Gruunaga]ASZ74484.1 hypothetical protein SEA_WIKS_12 [Mycoba
MQALQAKLAVYVLKQAVKYLKNHPDLIPGEVDDVIVRVLAKALGV